MYATATVAVLILDTSATQHKYNLSFSSVKVTKQAQRVQKMSLLPWVAPCKVLQKMVSENARNSNCVCTCLGHLGNTAQIESIWVISQGSQASTESTANVTVAG
jgi:hypothetical protein